MVDFNGFGLNVWYIRRNGKLLKWGGNRGGAVIKPQ